MWAVHFGAAPGLRPPAVQLLPWRSSHDVLHAPEARPAYPTRQKAAPWEPPRGSGPVWDVKRANTACTAPTATRAYGWGQ